MAPKARSKGKAKPTSTSGVEGTQGTKTTKTTKGTSETGRRKPQDATGTSNLNPPEVMIQQNDAQHASQQIQIESLLKEKSDMEATVSKLQKLLVPLEVIQQKEILHESERKVDKLEKTIADQGRTIADQDRTIADQNRTIADLENKVLELERKLEPHQDSALDKFMACCSKVVQYMGSIFLTRRTNTSRLTSHKMKVVSKVESIESIESSREQFEKLVKETQTQFGHIFKKEKFPSVTVTEFFTTTGYTIAYPLDETELAFYVNSTMEIPALTVARVVYEEILGKKGIISHGRAKVDAIEKRIHGMYDTYRKGARRPSKEKAMVDRIKGLRPGSFFYLEGRSNPFLICEYKADYKITEDDYEEFNSYLTEFTKRKQTKATMFYKYPKLPETEKSPSFTNFMELFEQINTYMTKYGSDEGFVTSGFCWIFFLGDPNKPGALKHYAVFIEDEESWIEAFEILLAMLLKPLLDYKGEKKWNEWKKQGNPITKIKERYESFTKDRDWKEPKNANDGNGGNGGDDDNSNHGDKNNEGNTTNKNNPARKRTSSQMRFESAQEPKRYHHTRSYTRKHKISPPSEQNCEVLQQYPRNENEEKTTEDEDEDEDVTLQSSDQSTIASTLPVKTPEKRPAPLAEYCTQKCLLGLKKNLPMDKKCPNYNIHKQNSRDKKLHPIKCNKLVSLFRQQLESDKVKIKYYDSKEGAVGKMVKFTVYPYGYTVVGKYKAMTYDYHADPLKYETAIYKEIEDLQGKWIPVCLGYVETYDEACILLSYGGENPETEEDYNHDTVWKIASLLRKHGVDHNDVRRENIVLNKELGHEMLIDFHVANSDAVDVDDYYTVEYKKYSW